MYYYQSKFVAYLTVKLGVGGFSMGAATALYSATCFTIGKYGNDNPYPANLSAVVGLSGWLPCAKYGLVDPPHLSLIHPALSLYNIWCLCYYFFLILIQDLE